MLTNNYVPSAYPVQRVGKSVFAKIGQHCIINLKGGEVSCQSIRRYPSTYGQACGCNIRELTIASSENALMGVAS